MHSEVCPDAMVCHGGGHRQEGPGGPVSRASMGLTPNEIRGL